MADSPPCCVKLSKRTRVGCNVGMMTMKTRSTLTIVINVGGVCFGTFVRKFQQRALCNASTWIARAKNDLWPLYFLEIAWTCGTCGMMGPSSHPSHVMKASRTTTTHVALEEANVTPLISHRLQRTVAFVSQEPQHRSKEWQHIKATWLWVRVRLELPHLGPVSFSFCMD